MAKTKTSTSKKRLRTSAGRRKRKNRYWHGGTSALVHRKVWWDSAQTYFCKVTEVNLNGGYVIADCVLKDSGAPFLERVFALDHFKSRGSAVYPDEYYIVHIRKNSQRNIVQVIPRFANDTLNDLDIYPEPNWEELENMPLEIE